MLDSRTTTNGATDGRPSAFGNTCHRSDARARRSVLHLLAQAFGAEVIRIEVPEGDWTRHAGPPGAARDAGLGAAFTAQAGDKKMLAVDIRASEGADILRDLILDAEVFVEGLRPGVVARAGFDETARRTLNPRLVFASITGFGQDGPFSAWPAYDHVIQAMSRLMSVTVTPESAPLRVGRLLATTSRDSMPPLP